MELNIDSYKLNKRFVLQWYEKNKKDYSPGQAVSVLAVSTMVPCIVIAYWIGEATDWHPEIIHSIQSLMKFYDYSGILNKPPGAPL